MYQLLDCDPTILAFVLLCLQIVLLFLLASGCHRFFRGRPKLQHFTWLTALLTMVVLVPLKFCVPAWDVELANRQVRTVVDPPQNPMPELKANAADFEDAAVGSNMAPIEEPFRFGESFADIDSLPQPKLVSMPATSEKATLSWLAVAATIYGSVTLLLLIRLLMGMSTLARIRSCARQPDPRMAVVVDSAIDELSLNRKPKVLVSERARVPMAFGVFRPTVVLPIDFELWDKEMQRMVLLHEGCHIKRCDAIWDLLSRVASAIYWFHPAVHLMSSFLKRTRESATDALVLEQQVSPTEYAKRLLAISSGSKACFQPALFMACHDDLRDRIGLILEFSSSRTDSRRRSILKKAAIAMALIPIGFVSAKFSFVDASVAVQTSQVQVEQADSKDAPGSKEKPNANNTGATFFERLQQIEPKEMPQTFSQKITITGRVQEANGRPVADAMVILRDTSFSFAIGTTGTINDVFAKTKTRKDGTFAFVDFSNPMRPHHRTPMQVFVATEDLIGYSEQLSVYADSSGVVALEEPVEVSPATSVTGRVVSPGGEPLKDVDVRFRYFSRPGAKGFDRQSHFIDRLISPSARTNAEGRFVLKGVPSDVAVGLSFDHSDYATNFELIRLSGHPEFTTPRGGEPREVTNNGSTIELDPGVKLSGVVLDGNSKPRPDVDVSTFFRTWKSGVDGKFEIRVLEEQLTDDSLELWTSGQLELKHNTRHRAGVGKLKAGTAKLICPIPATVRVRVVTEVGKTPIPGVEVAIDVKKGVGNRAFTDKNGFFQRGVDPRKIKIRVIGRKPGLDLDKVKDSSMELKPGEVREIKILVPALQQANVKVVGPDGAGVEGVDVGFCRDGQFQSILESGPDGVAGFDSWGKQMWADRLFARHSMDGRTFWAEADVSDPSKNQTLRLAPAKVLSGSITVEGEPLSDVTVEVLKTDAPRRRRVAKVKTGSDGKYSVAVPSRNFDGSAANYWISLERSSRIPNQQVGLIIKRATEAETEMVANIDLVSGSGVVSGKVVDIKGEPVENAFVNLSALICRERGMKNREYQPSEMFQSTSCYSDSEGNFSIEGLPVGFRAIIESNVQGKLIQGISMIAVGEREARLLLTEAADQSGSEAFR